MGSRIPFPGDADSTRQMPSDATIELGELKGILLHRRVLILGTAVLLTAIALAYALLTPPLYSATSQIIVDPRDRQVVSNDVNPSDLAPDGGITQVESQVAVVQSNGVLMRAIAAADLTQDPEFNKRSRISDFIDSLIGSEEESGDTKARDEARTLAELRRNLAVKRADKVLVIDVTVTSSRPEQAANLANVIAEAYLADQSEARARSAERASQDLTARLSELRQTVQDAENAVEQYKSANNIVRAGGVLVSEQALTDANTQLANARNLSSYLQARVEQIGRIRESGGSLDSLSEVIRSPVISNLREQETALDQRITDMATQFGPRHPTLVSARAQRSGIEQQIRAELDRIAASVSADYERAMAAEVNLEAQQRELENRTLATDQESVRLRELQRDLDAVREVYSNFLRRSQETREQSGIDSTNARIISTAIPPIRKDWPPTPLLVMGAVFGGLGLGAGFALVAEYASPTALSEAQVGRAAGAPVVAVLPAAIAATGIKRRWRPFWRWRVRGSAARSAAGATGTLGLLLRQLGADTVAHANTVPAILLCSTRGDAAMRTQVAAEFAATAASRGERVLLIDADIAEGGAHASVGLQDVLAGSSPFEAAVKDRFADRIDFLGSGRDRPVLKEDEALRFAERMLQDAATRYDLVVIDGGDFTDNIRAAALLGVARDVLVVARLRSTRLEAIRQQANAANIMGHQPNGVVLVGAGV